MQDYLLIFYIILSHYQQTSLLFLFFFRSFICSLFFVIFWLLYIIPFFFFLGGECIKHIFLLSAGFLLPQKEKSWVWMQFLLGCDHVNYIHKWFSQNSICYSHLLHSVKYQKCGIFYTVCVSSSVCVYVHVCVEVVAVTIQGVPEGVQPPVVTALSPSSLHVSWSEATRPNGKIQRSHLNQTGVGTIFTHISGPRNYTVFGKILR